MRPADDFRIASVTKPFVAAVVLQLVGEQKLRLDDTVEHWLPGVVPGGRRITVRELLNHTSGIPEYFEDARVQKALEDRHAVISPRKLIARAVSHPLSFEPGRNWGYSNTNYLLLGLIVEKVTGKSIRAELTERIFRPLGLTHTALEGPGRRHDKMRGYQISAGGSARDLTDLTLGGPWSDDGIVSNADDLGRFFSALLGGTLLQPRELRAMKTVAFPGSTVGIVSGGGAAGLGIFKSLAGCVAWGHGGQLPGYTTSVYASADGSRVAIFATNGESLPASRELDRMAADLFCSGS
jgi:D-alanyl-D-alanine carboxypeptidase